MGGVYKIVSWVPLLGARAIHLAVALVFAAMAGFSAGAANRFKFLGENAELPREKFIYAILDLKANQIYFGYSPDQAGPDQAQLTSDDPMHQGVRNGGHVALAFEVLGISSVNELEVLNPSGEGRLVGGGFVLGADNFIYIHPLMSVKAAGSNASAAYINPRLPSGRGAIMTEPYGRPFMQALVQRLNKPLVVDKNLFKSKRFLYNLNKHPDIAMVQKAIAQQAYWVDRVVSDVNRERFGHGTAGVDLARSSIRLGLAAMNYNRGSMKQYFTSEEGRRVFTALFFPRESTENVSDIDPFEVIQFMSQNLKTTPRLHEAVLKFLATESGVEQWKKADESRKFEVMELFMTASPHDRSKFFDFMIQKISGYSLTINSVVSLYSLHPDDQWQMEEFFKKVLQYEPRSFLNFLAVFYKVEAGVDYLYLDQMFTNMRFLIVDAIVKVLGKERVSNAVLYFIFIDRLPAAIAHSPKMQQLRRNLEAQAEREERIKKSRSRNLHSVSCEQQLTR